MKKEERKTRMCSLTRTSLVILEKVIEKTETYKHKENYYPCTMCFIGGKLDSYE